jgi:hypothetical protein
MLMGTMPSTMGFKSLMLDGRSYSSSFKRFAANKFPERDIAPELSAAMLKNFLLFCDMSTGYLYAQK